MNSVKQGTVIVSVLAIGLLAGLLLAGLAWPSALAGETAFHQTAATGARYTVVMTDGLHLVVTDNQSGTLYFYAIDDGEKPGADLKLRGSADLNQVGRQVIKPVLLKKN